MLSADPKSYPFQVADRFATLLAGMGVGVYGDDLSDTAEWVIVLGPDAPAGSVTCINITPSSPVYFRSDVTIGVQLKWRDAQDADPWAVSERVQQVIDWAHPNGRPRSSFRMGDLRFGRVDVSSSLVLGPDANRRPQATLNLEFHGRRVAALVPRISPAVFPDANGLVTLDVTVGPDGLTDGSTP